MNRKVILSLVIMICVMMLGLVIYARTAVGYPEDVERALEHIAARENIPLEQLVITNQQ